MRHITLLAMLWMWIVVPSAAASAEWTGEITTSGGEVHVKNPETAPEEVRIQLEELWVRGDDDDDEVMFGRVAQVVFDREDNLYVLDSQLSEINVFSLAGEYLETIGREGDGPGEFRSAFDMYLGPDGLLGLVRIFPGKVYQIGTDGSPADDFPLPAVEGYQLVYVGRANRDRVVIAGATQYREGGAQKQNTYLKAFDASGKELAHYYDETKDTRYGEMKYEEKKFSDFTRRWALADDGRVAAATEFDAYRIHVWKADGTLERVIERPGYTSLDRTDAQKERFQKFFDGITSWNPGSSFEISDTHVDVSRVWFRDNGHLWVLPSSGVWTRPEGVLASIDDYDREGRFVRRIHLVGDGDPVEDGIFIIGDRLYRVTELFSAVMAALGGDEGYEEGPTDPLRLVAYRMGAGAVVSAD